MEKLVLQAIPDPWALLALSVTPVRMVQLDLMDILGPMDPQAATVLKETLVRKELLVRLV